MTFTYNSASVTTALAKTRLEIGDTDSTAVLFTDEELNVYIDARADVVLLAAADACDALATRFARAYDFETDGQRFQRSQMSKAYRELGKGLRDRAAGIATLTPTRVDGYSDDITNTDVSSTDDDPRRKFWGPQDHPPY
ncbi:MAG: hypothetical protein NUW01_08845 [Gemmatimonadaceae bacterium]|nr:hypothetical protein [Gemmatimonadaceae bacterium]